VIELKVTLPTANEVRQELITLFGLGCPQECNASIDVPKVVQEELPKVVCAPEIVPVKAEADLSTEPPVKQRRKRRSSGENPTGQSVESEPVVESEAVVATPDPQYTDVEDDLPPVTAVTLRAAAVTMSDKVGSKPVFDILAQFGAAKVADLRPEQYREVLDLILELGKDGF
jgi:hypothetical protein